MMKDKFQKKVDEVMAISEKDRDDAINGLKELCMCPTCPTYNDCAGRVNEGLFCVLGKSESCISEKRGCNCPRCELAESLDVGIRYNTYCIMDAELNQRQI